MPTFEKLAAQGDSGSLGLEKQITVVGSRRLHGHQATSRRIALPADEAISVPVPGALAGL